jgi:putative PIN family toxin of toxin-antitoxin system
VKAVLDTNVVVSGIFFAGVPGRILNAWRDGKFKLVTSPGVLEEYRRVVAELSSPAPSLDVREILDVLTIHSELVEDRTLEHPICRDHDDDKFLACAASARALLVSGDKDLLAADRSLGVRVMTPRAFALQLGV